MSDAKKPDPKAEAAHPPAAEKGGGGSKLLPILVGVNSLLLVGVMVFLVLQMQKQQAAMTAALTEISKGGGAEKGKAGKEPKEEPREEKSEPKEEKSEGKGEEKSEGGEGKGEGGEGKGEGKGGGKGATMVKLPDFVVHLRNPDADRYARMSFEAEVYGESDKDRITSAMPRIRDAFISYLSDRTLEDLRGSEGLSRTKDSLQNTLRQVVPEARVRALYISDFVVQ